MKTINYYKVLSIKLLLVFTSLIQAQESIQIDIDYNNSQKLEKGVYGLNNNTSSRPYYLSHSGFISKYEELGKPVMRFPGGTNSNYINLKTGFAQLWNGNDDKDRDRFNSINKGFEKAGKKQSGEDYRQYAKFLSTTNGSSTFVVNITTMSVNDTKNVLNNIKNLGGNIDFFEIGNELYYNQYKAPIPNINTYIRRAKNVTEVIKEIFPEAKVGVLVPSSPYTKESFLDGPPDTGNRQELWYDAIKQDRFYDAIVVHLYSTVGMKGITSTNEFIPFEEAYTHSISHADKKFTEAISKYKTDFPNAKIWITEYHVGGFSGIIRQYRLRESYLGGLFTANFMFKMFKENQITMSSWHSMVQMLTYTGKRGELLPDDHNFGTLVNYDFFKFFRDPIKNANRFIPANFGNIKKYQGTGEYEGTFEDVEGGVFYNNTNKKGTLMIFNKKNTNYKISKSALEKTLQGTITNVIEIAPKQDLLLEEALNSSEEKSLGEITSNNGNYSIHKYAIYKINFVKTEEQNIAPELTILQPTDTNTYFEGDNLVVRADANDQDGEIREVRLYLNGELIRIDTEAPYGWGGNEKLQNLATGNYRVRVVAIDNEGLRTKKVTIIQVLPESLKESGFGNENNNKATLIISPNPVKGTYVNIFQKGNWYLRLYDITGKQIMNLNPDNQAISLDISNLPSGVYILKSDKTSSRFIIR
ncbi:Ig-like domain-containing protein [uncultured Aquimarina sp.]|uniref:Ig-like domain-containing protein n=1 Tax=uncultured Aquimarina sp. TaxID=575652 RepID=UPI0026043BC8|nr:Ig-like domain-containing protein [uncultured Aquimarina sp.]